MDMYQDFAHVYDELMDQTPYQEWCLFVVSTIERYGISKPSKAEQDVMTQEKNLVLDLGCGTGKLTEQMAGLGYDMIGVDLSAEMLSIAMERRDKLNHSTLYLCQDMRELELYSTIGTVISLCDSINYLLDPAEVLATFRLVNNYLFPGGIFLFDFNTVYKYEQVLGECTIAENRDDCSFIWENYYDPEEKINQYDVTVFVAQEGDLPDHFRRFQETHFQRGYTPVEMAELVRQAGMQVEWMLDADTHKEVTPESERVYLLAREVEKSGKE